MNAIDLNHFREHRIVKYSGHELYEDLGHEELNKLADRFDHDQAIVNEIKRCQGFNKVYVQSPFIPFGWIPNYSLPKDVTELGHKGVSHGATDNPYKPLDQVLWSDNKYRATFNVLGQFKRINTSCDLIAHDNYIAALNKSVVIHVYLLSGNDDHDRKAYPSNCSYKRQINAIKKLKDAGVKVVTHKHMKV